MSRRRLRPLTGLGIALVFFCMSCSPDDEKSRSSSEESKPLDTGAQAFTLDDGSELILSDVESIDDWACGTRKAGTMEVSGQSGRVVLYFDREENLVSIRANNQSIYDATGDRECLKNWKTGQMELLTEAEYKKFEAEKFGE